MTLIAPYLLVGFCVFTLAAGQVMFKLVSGRIDTLWSLTTDLRSLALLGFAVSLYAVSTLAWIVALQRLPLSHAYLFIAFGFLLVPLAAYFILGEPLSPRLLAGYALVIAGIWVAVT